MVAKYDSLEVRMATYLKGDEGRAERFKDERAKFLQDAADERDRLVREKEDAVREMKRPIIIKETAPPPAPIPASNMLSAPAPKRVSSPAKASISGNSPEPKNIPTTPTPDEDDAEASAASDWDEDEPVALANKSPKKKTQPAKKSKA